MGFLRDLIAAGPTMWVPRVGVGRASARAFPHTAGGGDTATVCLAFLVSRVSTERG
jgi:hypothetical protein